VTLSAQGYPLEQPVYRSFRGFASGAARHKASNLAVLDRVYVSHERGDGVQHAAKAHAVSSRLSFIAIASQPGGRYVKRSEWGV